MKNKLIITIVIVFAILAYISTKYLYPMLISVRESFKKALTIYDPAIVENAERIYRLETGNFTSGQFFHTGWSAGMTDPSKQGLYPFGWTSLSDFWDANPDYKPVGSKVYGKAGLAYVTFPSVEAAIMTLCEKLHLNGNSVTAWNGGDDTEYQSKIDAITPSITQGYES
jgi:hypothetical protein